jgi:hypothetical protein
MVEKKLGCSKKKTLPCKYHDSSNLSCSSGSSDSSTLSCQSSSYSSSYTYGFCCYKYPKCNCKPYKCSPIYYPNNCVNQSPCNPYSPLCPSPYTPNPCVPSPCSSVYNTYNIIIKGNQINFNILQQYTLYIVDPSDGSGNLYLPLINNLGVCCYNKMFVISNINGTNSIMLNPAQNSNDIINGLSQVTIQPNSSVTVYSSLVSGFGNWACV